MEQWTLIETGSHTNKDLAGLMANFGWVSLFLIDKMFKNATKNLFHDFLIYLTKTYRS